MLEVLLERRHPLTIVTKGALILRDLDLLARAGRAAARLGVRQPHQRSTTTLKRTLEPRAASPQARLRVMRELAAAGVPVGVMLAPVIPALNDHEIERAARGRRRRPGRDARRFMMLRLPFEVGAPVRGTGCASTTRSAPTAC